MILNEKIIQDTLKLVEELCFLLQSLHPIETLKRAYWEFIYQHLEVTVESEIGTEAVHSTVLIEYLHSLFISIDLKKDLRPPTNEEEWKNIKEKVRQIYDNCRSPFIINQDDKSISQEDKILFHQILTSWIQIRGKFSKEAQAYKDLSSVQASLGHTSSRMTEKYAKIVALLNRSTAEKITRAFNLFGGYSKNHSENHSKGEDEN